MVYYSVKPQVQMFYFDSNTFVPLIFLIKYRVIWIPSVLTVFSLRMFSLEVKVVQSWFNSE